MDPLFFETQDPGQGHRRQDEQKPCTANKLGEVQRSLLATAERREGADFLVRPDVPVRISSPQWCHSSLCTEVGEHLFLAQVC